MLVLRLILGLVATLLGVAGLLLPIMPGWLFFLVAAAMFFPNSPWVEKVLRKAEPVMPSVTRLCRRVGVGCPPDPKLRGHEHGEIFPH